MNWKHIRLNRSTGTRRNHRDGWRVQHISVKGCVAGNLVIVAQGPTGKHDRSRPDQNRRSGITAAERALEIEVREWRSGHRDGAGETHTINKSDDAHADILPRRRRLRFGWGPAFRTSVRGGAEVVPARNAQTLS